MQRHMRLYVHPRFIAGATQEPRRTSAPEHWPCMRRPHLQAQQLKLFLAELHMHLAQHRLLQQNFHQAQAQHLRRNAHLYER